MMNTRKKIHSFRLNRLDRVHPEIVGHSLMAWAFLKAQRVPALVVDDMRAFEAWMKEFKGDASSGYFGKFVPGYLAYWPSYRATRETLWKDQLRVKTLAKPNVRRYALTPVRR